MFGVTEKARSCPGLSPAVQVTKPRCRAPHSPSPAPVRAVGRPPAAVGASDDDGPERVGIVGFLRPVGDFYGHRQHNSPGTTTPNGGTVSFIEGNTTLATEPLAAGTAAWTAASLGAGQHVVTATYSGDGTNFAGSTTTVGPDSIITTVAGNGSATYNGDGIQATAALLSYPVAVAVGPPATFYCGFQ